MDGRKADRWSKSKNAGNADFRLGGRDVVVYVMSGLVQVDVRRV